MFATIYASGLAAISMLIETVQGINVIFQFLGKLFPFFLNLIN